MSVLSDHKKDVQIWNNAVFDSDNQIKSPSWFANKPLSVNRSSDSFDSSKENQTPKSLHQSKPLKNIPINAEDKTDEEIEIEKEIIRLYAKLDCIRRNRIQGRKTGDDVKNGLQKIQEPGFSKVQRRGFSLGPNEIISAATNSKSKTPVQLTTQNRRKSCFWKLDDIEEEKMTLSKGKNMTSLRQAVTSVGSKKGMKKDESMLASIQPKKLFGEQQSVVGVKKPLKPGRVIPSRYNQPTVNSLIKNRSFTDNNVDKRKSFTEVRVKKKWEIPSAIVVAKRLDLDDNENENENETEDAVRSIDVVAMPVVLPRIRAVRVVDETGRDSGPAKRVAQLVGKKSYFAQEDEETVCQTLCFENDCDVV